MEGTTKMQQEEPKTFLIWYGTNPNEPKKKKITAMNDARARSSFLNIYKGKGYKVFRVDEVGNGGIVRKAGEVDQEAVNEALNGVQNSSTPTPANITPIAGTGNPPPSFVQSLPTSATPPQPSITTVQNLQPSHTSNSLELKISKKDDKWEFSNNISEEVVNSDKYEDMLTSAVVFLMKELKNISYTRGGADEMNKMMEYTKAKTEKL